MPIDLSKYRQEEKAEQKTVREDRSSILNREIKVFIRKFGAKEKEALYGGLGMLLATGVDLKTSFEIIEEDIRRSEHRQLIAAVKDAVIRGEPFHAALSCYPESFSSYEIHGIRIGEETGRLPEILKELAAYYHAVIRLRRQIVGIMTYPLVVTVVAVLIVYFMLSFVVPVFSDIFLRTGQALPPITRLLITISDRSGVFFTSLMIVVAGLLVFHRLSRHQEWYRKLTSSAVLKVPVIGPLVQKIYLARFCQSMKLLTGARVMFNESLGLVREMIGFYPLEVALDTVRKDVINHGLLLHESLASHKVFPRKLVTLVKLSEEVNEPEMIFEKLHQEYTAEIEHQQALLGKLLEPVFIILLGGFVGFILVAMYLPMFEMSTSGF